MNPFKTVVLLLSVLCACGRVRSEPRPCFADHSVRFRNYNIQDGLASNEVNTFCQDSRGFLWFGTTNGLSRFDGYEFATFRSSFRNPDYFSSNMILKIEEDRDNNLWLVTSQGVNVFCPRTQTVRKIDSPLFQGKKVNTLKVLDDGNVLIGAVNGLFRYDRELDSLLPAPYRFAGRNAGIRYIRDIFVDRGGNIWIGTWRRGAAVIAAGSDRITALHHPGMPANLTVNCFTEDAQGNIYVGSWEAGVFRVEHPLDRKRMQVRKLAPGERGTDRLDPNIIYDMQFDRQGDLWVGNPGGVRIVARSGDRPPAGSPMAAQNRIPHISFHEVRQIFRDREGSLWFSDYGNGIFVAQPYRSEIRETDFRDKGLNSSAVTAVYRDADSILWLGVKGLGLIRYDPKNESLLDDRLSPLASMDAQSNAVIGFAAVPERGVLFMATRYYGVYMVRRQGSRIVGIRHFDTSRKDPVRSIFTQAIAGDSQQNVWVGTKSGLVLLRRMGDGGEYALCEPQPLNDSLGSCSVETIFADRDGAMWVGSTESGLFRFRYDSRTGRVSGFRRYAMETGGINSNRIQTVYQDRRGAVWVGTHGGGLHLYDPQEDCFRIVENMHLLASDIIHSVTEDDRGNLWLATGNGIACYDPLTGGSDLRNYNGASGLKNVSFIKNSVLRDGAQILFGGYDGLSVFRPEELLTAKEVAPPSITDILLFNESLSQLPEARKRRIAAVMLPYTDHITLSHKDYSFSIRFASPNGGDNRLNKYAYRLEEIDRDWNYVTNDQRTITYTHLSPGSYTFSVLAGSDQGGWTTEPARLRITVLPAPWLTHTAFAGYLLLTALAAYAVFRMVRNRIRLKQALEIEQVERQKSEELNNAKLVFFTNVSHELFSPITVMSCALEKLLEKESGDAPLHRVIRSNLNRLMRLLQQILEFRKAESANLKLKVSERDITAFAKQLCDENFLPGLVNNKNIRLIFSADPERLRGYVDSDKLDKILYNLLSNAFKYNRQDGKVFVEIRAETELSGRYARIVVRDTGPGIEPERLPRLFKRFYEGDYRKFDTKGTGIGLSLTKDLVELHKGTIGVESTPGEGTAFAVRLPIDPGAYSPEQFDSGVIFAESETQPAQAVYGPDPEGKERDTILLVEDNEELLLVMQNIFSPRYGILTARNGAEALELLAGGDIDLVITDYVMPCMDGVELCRRIRGDISLSHLPIIMLSARSMLESKLESYRAGVDVYVSKPFEVRLLATQVDALIANRRRLADRFRHGQQIETDSLINTELDKQFIDKAIALIETHIADAGFDINAFNQAMNMSNSTLYRKIKSITGMSPKEFIRNIRFKIACKLLLEKSSNISDVAFMVGFSDAKYFSLSFKKEFGMSPREYINRHGKRKTEVGL